jgi:plastocyanin
MQEIQGQERLSQRSFLRVTGGLGLLGLSGLVSSCGLLEGLYGYRDGGQPEAPEKPIETARVEIRNFAFQPATIRVKVGTTVTWTQQDSIPHTVTSRTGLFDSGSLSLGETFEYTFDELGTYEYYCTIHPSMTGRVIVE